MPLLRKNGKELLFAHIPKCGGTSLEEAFTPDVQLTLMHSGPGELPCSPQHFHASLLEKLFDYRVPPAVTIVRHPFDRIVSEYRYQLKTGLNPNIGFDEFVENSLGEFWKNKYVHDNHIRPQVEFICSDSVIFTFEEDGVAAAGKYIADFFELADTAKIPVMNASEKVDFSVAPKTIRLINKFYARDFELLGYSELDVGEASCDISSLNFSSKPTTDHKEPPVIRQKVSNDMMLVSESDKSRMATQLEQADNDRQLATEAAANFLEVLNKQSAEYAEMKDLIDGLHAEIKSTDKHLVDKLNRLFSALDTNELTLESIGKIVEKMTSSVKEEFQERYARLADRDEKVATGLASFAEKLRGIDINLEEFRSSVTEALRAERERSAERELAAERMTREQQTWVARSKDNVDDAAVRIIEELDSYIDSTRTHLSKSVERLREGLASEIQQKSGYLEQKIIGVERELDETAGRVIGELGGAIKSQSMQVTDSVDAVKKSLNTGIHEKAVKLEQNLTTIQLEIEKMVGRIVSELSSTLRSQTTQMSESVEGLRERLNSGADEKTGYLERRLYRVKQELSEDIGKAAGDVGKTVGDVSDAVESQAAIVAESIGGLRSHFDTGLSANTAQVAQLISGLEQALAHFGSAQEASRQEEQREVVEQLKSLITAQQQKIHELDKRLEVATSQLTEAKSKGLTLDSKLQEAETRVSGGAEQLNALQDETAKLEEERANLLQVLDSMVATAAEMQRSNAANASTWERDRAAMTEEMASLRSTLEHAQQYEKELKQEQLATVNRFHQESTALRKELSDTLEQAQQSENALKQEQLATVNRFHEESTALRKELSDGQKQEQELRRELQETVNRFHAEISYRESFQEKVRRLEADNAELVRQNNALLESTSFRVTKPLRALSKALRPRRGSSAAETVLRLEDLRNDTAPPPQLAHLSHGVLTRNSQLNIAIVVENLDRGGLEQVVLDHARFFNQHCNSLILFVINEIGQVYEQALAHGIIVVCVKEHNVNLDEYLRLKHFDFAFFHHSYGYLPAFRPSTDKIVEVIHNEYSWQKDIEFFESIRETAIDQFIAVSDPVRDYAIENLAIKPARIVTVVNGLNIEGLIRPPLEVLYEHRMQTLKGSPTFIMCANGQPQKNHVLVIRAFVQVLKKYPKAKLQLAGNMAVNDDVSEAINAELEKCNHSPSIEMLGSLNRRELSKFLANAHIALLPTKYEGFSIATLEYLYFGLPMVLSNTGGASYIANNYDNVIIDKKIVSSEGPPSSAEVKSLATNMRKMIAQYETFSGRSELAARSYQSYTVDAVCLEYLNTED